MPNTEYAVVVPADLGKDAYKIEWLGDTLTLMYQHIGCDMVQLIPASGEMFHLWADEEAKMTAPHTWVFNPRATLLWHEANEVADVLIGNVLVTSGKDPGDGRTVGLTEDQADELIAAMVEAGDERRVLHMISTYGVPVEMLRRTGPDMSEVQA